MGVRFAALSGGGGGRRVGSGHQTAPPWNVTDQRSRWTATAGGRRPGRGVRSRAADPGRQADRRSHNLAAADAGDAVHSGSGSPFFPRTPRASGDRCRDCRGGWQPLLAGRLPGGDTGFTGVVFVAAATLAWALDNVISRTLADHDPLAVVALKGLLGGGISAAVAAASGELFPSATLGAALFVIGAVGFGLSLQLYLRAQTLVGAARTASVFAAAPFVGSVVSLALGSPLPGWHFPIAAGLLVVGVALHVSERHRHQHTHEPLVHEHMHTHDDQHHGHTHDPMPSGPHSHPHEHTRLTHEHEHSDDIHHRHRH